MNAPMEQIAASWVWVMLTGEALAISALLVAVKVLFSALMTAKDAHKTEVASLQEKHAERMEKTNDLVITAINNNTNALKELQRERGT